MIQETGLPFKLDKTDDTITPLAGLALFGEFLEALGLEEKVGRAFPAPGSARGYGAWGYVRPLLLMLHGGGRALEDLRKVQGGQVFSSSVTVGVEADLPARD